MPLATTTRRTLAIPTATMIDGATGMPQPLAATPAQHTVVLAVQHTVVLPAQHMAALPVRNTAALVVHSMADLTANNTAVRHTAAPAATNGSR